MQLNVHACNTNARAFYTRMGFSLSDPTADTTVLEMVRVRK